MVYIIFLVFKLAIKILLECFNRSLIILYYDTFFNFKKYTFTLENISKVEFSIFISNYL